MRRIARIQESLAGRDHLSDKKEPTAIVVQPILQGSVRDCLGFFIRIDAELIEQLPERSRIDYVSLR
ncbi:MAG TPA: hypothetical protein VKR61_25965 [Bryobacteraceae bacterium]|nr:hypothetical protein [Bryobacteraceae bacterium]